MSTLKKYLAISALSLTVFSQNMWGMQRPNQFPIPSAPLMTPTNSIRQNNNNNTSPDNNAVIVSVPNTNNDLNAMARLAAAMDRLAVAQEKLVAGQHELIRRSKKPSPVSDVIHGVVIDFESYHDDVEYAHDKASYNALYPEESRLCTLKKYLGLCCDLQYCDDKDKQKLKNCYRLALKEWKNRFTEDDVLNRMADSEHAYPRKVMLWLGAIDNKTRQFVQSLPKESLDVLDHMIKNNNIHDRPQ